MDDDAIDGESPWKAEERYRLRMVLKAFDGLSLEDMVEVKRLAQTGRFARTVLVVISKIVGYLGAIAAAVVTYKSIWGKGL